MLKKEIGVVGKLLLEVIMFIQPPQAESIKGLTSTKDLTKQVEDVLSILATNSIEDMHNAFRQAIRENPLDPTPRMIYADFLEEHGDPTKAALHRAIANDPRMMENIRHPMRIGFDPSFRARTTRQWTPDTQWRPATSRETSASAHRFSIVRSRNLGVKAATEARKLAAAANRFAKSGDSKQAAEHHYLAAVKHLQAAREVDNRGTIGRGIQTNLETNLGYLRNGGHQIPAESEQALNATIEANRRKGVELHRVAAVRHYIAERHNINLYEQTDNPTHIHIAGAHHLLGSEHNYISEHAANDHRNAAYAHIIAARVHEEQ